MDIILGSQSPRRAAILSNFSLPFRAIPSTFDEGLIPHTLPPEDFVLNATEGKMADLRGKYPTDTIITSDTIVVHEGLIFCKPFDQEEGFRMLRALSGKWHTVYTGVALGTPKEVYTAIEKTRVLINALTDEEIEKYQTLLHCWDKAGGYAIQGAGGLIVKSIEGCFYNVMGLPINSLRVLLKNIGIDLWDYLKN